MGKYIRTYESFDFSDRLDNAFDWMKKCNIKPDQKVIDEYIQFNNANLERIENMVKQIKTQGYVWTADVDMFFVAPMSDLEDGTLEPEQDEIKVYQIDITDFYYNFTHAWVMSYDKGIDDKYRIIYKGGEEDGITAAEILSLSQKGAVMLEHGPIGLNPEAVKKLVQEM